VNTVQPIRDKQKIEEIKAYLKSKSLRDWALFTLGINSALRVSDLLKLNVSDVCNENGNIRDRIKVKEKKTGKSKDFPFTKKVVQALTEYITISHPKEVLFPSQKGGKALGRGQVHTILSNAAKAVGIKEPISSHSMRKSFGFHAYEKGVSIQTIQAILNHSSERETLRYIGITQDGLDETYMDMDL
jgi:site-specific recombinase XerD